MTETPVSTPDTNNLNLLQKPDNFFSIPLDYIGKVTGFIYFLGYIRIFYHLKQYNISTTRFIDGQYFAAGLIPFFLIYFPYLIFRYVTKPEYLKHTILGPSTSEWIIETLTNKYRSYLKTIHLYLSFSAVFNFLFHYLLTFSKENNTPFYIINSLLTIILLWFSFGVLVFAFRKYLESQTGPFQALKQALKKFIESGRITDTEKEDEELHKKKLKNRSENSRLLSIVLISMAIWFFFLTNLLSEIYYFVPQSFGGGRLQDIQLIINPSSLSPDTKEVLLQIVSKENKTECEQETIYSNLTKTPLCLVYRSQSEYVLIQPHKNCEEENVSSREVWVLSSSIVIGEISEEE